MEDFQQYIKNELNRVEGINSQDSETPYYMNETWKVMAQSELPYLPTPMDAVENLFRFLHENGYIDKNTRLVDLGAGDGRIIIHAAEKYGIYSVGVEINSELIEYARNKINEKKINSHCAILERDLYDFDISHFDIITCFVLPTNQRFFKRILNQIKPNALFISVKWPFKEIPQSFIHIHTLHMQDQPNFTIYIYKKVDNTIKRT